MHRFYIFVFTLFFSLSTIAGPVPSRKLLKLSALFSDHMVLQQQQQVNFWGQSGPGQKISISASWGKHISTVADLFGHWKTKLQTTVGGGPYTVKVSDADSTIVLKDVLIGEVWLASGQSNMEIPLQGWPPGDTILNSAAEIAAANYPMIRFLKVPLAISLDPVDSLKAEWKQVSPVTAGNFSAAAYFFARKLHLKLKVPVGIIVAAVGGTPAESWTGRNYLSKLGDFKAQLDSLAAFQRSVGNWVNHLPGKKSIESDKNRHEINFTEHEAAESNFDDSHWASLQLPGRFDDHLPAGKMGTIWFRKKITISKSSPSYKLVLDNRQRKNEVYINGHKLLMLIDPVSLNNTAQFDIPGSLLVKGDNTIAMRVIYTGGYPGIEGPVQLKIFLVEGPALTDLAGDWKYRMVTEYKKGMFYSDGLLENNIQRPELSVFNSNSPTVLFNAMINPLIPYTIKGVIWYQGESNVGRAAQYKRLFPLMIEDWRNKWQKELPFYYVQLAPFSYSNPGQHQVSQELRDAQRYALKLPHTGMVSTLDIGYLKTAHPPYKQAVGNRLAGFALANEYGRKLITSGPNFKSVVVSSNLLLISFTSVGSGLKMGPSGLNNFEIAGADRVYVRAKAVIKNNQVVVSNPSIDKPLYVRYAWSDTSTASLFNKEGLPASTFTSEK